MQLHTIVSITDPLYDCWLDLYQRSFPLDQQLLVSFHNRALRALDAASQDVHYLAALADDPPECVGMALYEVLRPVQAAALWYLAVAPERRSEGIGGWMYDRIMQRIRLQYPACRACVIEVELPELCPDPEAARRRIAFYERHGAVRLTECTTTVDVGWQPPLTLGVMVHPLVTLAPSDMRAVAEAVLGGPCAPATSAKAAEGSRRSDPERVD